MDHSSLKWEPIATLRGKDRAVAEQLLDKYDVAGPYLQIAVRSDSRVAHFKSRNGYLLAFKIPSGGSCGYEFEIFISEGNDRNPLWTVCADDMWFDRDPTSGVPDLIAAEGDLAARRNRWDGHTWRPIDWIATLPPSDDLTPLDIKESRAQLAALNKSYDYAALFKFAAVRAPIENALGQEFPHFLENMGTRIPLEIKDGYLIALGMAPHSGGSEYGAVAIGLDHGDVYAAFFTDPKLTIVSKRKQFDQLPSPFQELLTGQPSFDPARISIRFLPSDGAK